MRKPTLRLNSRRHLHRAAALVLFVLLLSACSAPAAQAPAVDAPAAQVAMVDTPQALAPAAYQEQFLDAGAAHQLIDVRTAEEYATGHIPGAVNIPLQELGQRLNEVAADQPLVLYCRSGNRSASAATLLIGRGYTGIYNREGITALQAAGLPVAQPAAAIPDERASDRVTGSRQRRQFS